MSTAGSTSSCAPSPRVATPARLPVMARLADYAELTKPKIVVLALITVAVGYTLGSRGEWEAVPLLHALLGIGLVAAGSSALNQWFERSTDALMPRTAVRPLPSGRLQPFEVFLFGLALGGLGTIYLAAQVNAATAGLSALTLVLYAGVYTPLKRKTSLCTAIGAIPGALPPVLGWTAAGGVLDAGAFTLFAIMFLWQFPHFLAIAWLYRNEYAQAGLRMLPAYFPSPRVTGLMGVGYALALIPASLLPRHLALAGDAYQWFALLLGAVYLGSAVRFMLWESRRTARGVLWTSLIYLPVLLLALTWDHLQLLQ